MFQAVLIAVFRQYVFGITLSLTSTFLILLVLVQRGRGGGLAGAFGGMGGQSAFGTKAGDTFTRITIGVATVWILCAILAVKLLGSSGGGPLGDANAAAPPTVTTNAEDDGGADVLDDLPAAGTDAGGTDAASGGGEAENTAEADPAAE